MAVNEYFYKKIKYIKPEDIVTEEDLEQSQYIIYNINGEFIDSENNPEIEYSRWEIEGFNNASSEIIKDEDGNFILKIEKLEDVYEYKGSIKVITNFGESIIDDIYFELQRLNVPYLNSNEIYNEDTGITSYKVTRNSKTQLIYQMTGDNVVKNSDVSYVNWSIEGFNNCATISNTGLITLTKNKDLYNFYEGYVTVETNFGTATQIIKFDDSIDIYNVRLNWNSDPNNYVTDKYMILKEVHDSLASCSGSEELGFRYEVETTNGYVSCGSAAQLNGIIPSNDLSVTNSSVTVSLRAKWNNCWESYAVKYYTADDVIIYRHKYLSNTNKKIILRPQIGAHYTSTSYTNGTGSTYIMFEREDDYDNYIDMKWKYNKSDFSKFNNLSPSRETLPCIEITGIVEKDGQFYCETEPIRLHVGFICKLPPKLTGISSDSRSYSTSISKKDGYFYADFSSKDSYPLTVRISGENIDEYKDSRIMNISWSYSGFSYMQGITYKNGYWILSINPTDEHSTDYSGTITINTNHGSASMNVWLHKFREYPPKITFPVNGSQLASYQFDIIKSSSSTYRKIYPSASYMSKDTSLGITSNGTYSIYNYNNCSASWVNVSGSNDYIKVEGTGHVLGSVTLKATNNYGYATSTFSLPMIDTDITASNSNSGSITTWKDGYDMKKSKSSANTSSSTVYTALNNTYFYVDEVGKFYNTSTLKSYFGTSFTYILYCTFNGQSYTFNLSSGGSETGSQYYYYTSSTYIRFYAKIASNILSMKWNHNYIKGDYEYLPTTSYNLYVNIHILVDGLDIDCGNLTSYNVGLYQ